MQVRYTWRGAHGLGHDHALIQELLPPGLLQAHRVTTRISNNRVDIFIETPRGLEGEIPPGLRPVSVTLPNTVSLAARERIPDRELRGDIEEVTV